MRKRSRLFNSTQDKGGGRGTKSPPYQFSPITSTNAEVRPQDFVTFSFNTFATLMSNCKAILSASTRSLNLNQDHPQKKWFFWSNPYKIEVIITSLIEINELPDFGHMMPSTI